MRVRIKNADLRMFLLKSIKKISGGKESSSGIGSDFVQTKIIIREIPIIFHELDVNSFLDVPCGDQNWMQKTNP